MTWIFDLDGTLCDISHRLHFIQQQEPDWRGFFAACPKDVPIVATVVLARALALSDFLNHRLVIVTGRSDECQPQTVDWLLDHNIPYAALYMRKQGDHREDSVVKMELLDQVIRKYGKVVGVFEDRQQVVDAYRARGLRVYQVAEGKF